MADFEFMHTELSKRYPGTTLRIICFGLSGQSESFQHGDTVPPVLLWCARAHLPRPTGLLFRGTIRCGLSIEEMGSHFNRVAPTQRADGSGSARRWLPESRAGGSEKTRFARIHNMDLSTFIRQAVLERIEDEYDLEIVNLP